MPRSRIKEGETTHRVTVSLADSDLVELDRLARRHGGRSAAIRHLILTHRPIDPAPAIVAAPGTTGPAVAPATGLSGSLTHPEPTYPVPGPAGGTAVEMEGFGMPASCPSCDGPTKRLAAPGTIECFRCGYRGRGA